MQELRFGIIGCGLISRFHAMAIQDTPGAILTACVSHSPESSEKFGSDFGCTVFPDVESMLRSGAVDAVAICTPSGSHLEPALQSIEAGMHVLVEKPLEITPARCDELISAANSRDVRLATVFQSRFAPVWKRLYSAVAGHEFGRIAIADASVKWFRPQSYYDSAAWRGTWNLDGGGALMNQAIHTVDLLCWIMGPVRRVSAVAATVAHERIEVEDTIVATLEYASGAIGTITATTASHPGQDKRIEIHGDRGTAIVVEDHIEHWSGKSGADFTQVAGEHQESGTGASDPAGIKHHLHAAQYADFVEAVRERRPPMVDGYEGRISVNLVDAIYRSARERAFVEVD